MDPKPVVFHFNNSEWRSQQQATISAIQEATRRDARLRGIGATDDLDIIVCNSGEAPELTQECLDEMGISYHWLGRGVQNWVNAWKIVLCNDFLQTASSRYVLHLDASDVLIRADPAEIVARFLRFDCEMLFNAEVNFFYNGFVGFGTAEHRQLGARIRQQQFQAYSAHAAKRRSASCRCEMHTASQTHRLRDGIQRRAYTYLNSGCWIGKTAFARQMFQALLLMRDDVGVFVNDQPYMHMLHNRYYPHVQIDNQCSIFQCGMLCHDADFFL